MTIEELIERRATAVGARDAAAALANTAPDVVVFDAMVPLRRIGQETEAERLGQWLSSFQSPVGYEVRDLQVVEGDSVAFCHYLYRISGTTAAGGIDMWLRCTLGLRRLEGAWTIVHEHVSVPFDATGAADMTAQP